MYLDNAATSFPKPEVVYQTMDRFLREYLFTEGSIVALEAEAEGGDDGGGATGNGATGLGIGSLRRRS